MLLFLSDVSGSEVLVILLVILVFFGPKSIPGIAKTFGKTIYQIKQASDDLKSELSKSGMDIKKEINLDRIFERTENEVQNTVFDPIKKEINEVDKSLNSISYNRNNPQIVSKDESESVSAPEETSPKSELADNVSDEKKENDLA